MSAFLRLDREEGHVVELPDLGLALVHLITDAPLAKRALLVLLASGGWIAIGKAPAPAAVINPTQRVGGHGVHSLQTVDESLLAGAL